MYHQATVAALLSRSWRVRKRAQQTIRKLLSSLGGSSLAHGLLGELRVVINKHKVQNHLSFPAAAGLDANSFYWLYFYLTDNTVNFQVLPQDSVVSESGELTELGRSYVPPRVLLDALCVVCSSASQWGDPAEAESLAMETLIVSHHPSIGTWFSQFDNPEVCCYSALVVVAASEMSHSTFIFFSGSSPWPLACSPLLHELESWRVHRKQPGGYSPTAAQSRCRQPGLTISTASFLVFHICLYRFM